MSDETEPLNETAAVEPVAATSEPTPGELMEAVVVEVVELDDPSESTESAVDPAIPQPESGYDLAFILEAISSLDLSIQKRLDTLQSTFEREVRAESTREKVVDRLHAELQEYKNDLLLNTLRPVFIDLIQLHDDIGKIVNAGETDPGRLIELMKGFQQGIEDILYRQGVEPYQNLDDDLFDPRRQRAYASVPNDDPARSKHVAARLRKGFQAGEKIIRPEIVTVHAAVKQG